mgnify:CR=1 FL=1
MVVRLQTVTIFNIVFLILICLPLTILVVICIPIIYGTSWAYTHSDLEKLLVSPSSLFTAEIVGLLAGVNIKDTLSSDFFHQNKSTPVYEIHMNLKYKKAILTKEDILDLFRGIGFHLAGSIIYTITPMNLERIIREYSVPYSHVIALKSKINPKRAIKIRNKPSHYWFYLVKL